MINMSIVISVIVGLVLFVVLIRVLPVIIWLVMGFFSIITDELFPSKKERNLRKAIRKDYMERLKSGEIKEDSLDFSFKKALNK